MGASRKQSTPNFPKNDHFLLPDTYTYVLEKLDKKNNTNQYIMIKTLSQHRIESHELLKYTTRISNKVTISEETKK